MSAVVSVRVNPTLKSTYLRLRAAGKLPKLALIACMLKLLTIFKRYAQARHAF